MLTETPKEKPTLSDLIRHLDPADIVIVEGFKTEEQEALRLEVWRKLERHETPICARQAHRCGRDRYDTPGIWKSADF